MFLDNKVKTVTFFLFLSSAFILNADIVSSGQDGKALANSTRDYFSNNIENTINKPLTSSDTSMKTVNQEKSFDGSNISCTSSISGVFLRLNYNVEPITDDISINVEFDRDVDGIIDINTIDFYNSSLMNIPPVPVSGVCTDGVISCNSGSWSDCKFYQWQYTGSAIQLAETLRNEEDLASCQCTNASCLSPATTQKNSVVSVLGEGIFSQVFGANEGMIIADVSNNNGEIKYYGQNNASCLSGSTTSTYTGTLESKGQQAINDELLNSNSPSSTLLNSEYASGNAPLTSTNNFINNNYGSEISASDQNTLNQRNGAVSNSVSSSDTNSSLSFSYSDTRLDENGEIVTDVTNATIIKRDDTVVLFCQVEWSGDESYVFSTNENAQTTTTGLSEVVNMQTRKCVNGICPIEDANETIKHNCGDVNNFGEVVAELNAVEEATKDMICSTK